MNTIPLHIDAFVNIINEIDGFDLIRASNSCKEWAHILDQEYFRRKCVEHGVNLELNRYIINATRRSKLT